MKKQIKSRGPRRGIHELAARALAEVAGGAGTSLVDPYPASADALSYDPYRKFK